MEGHVRDIRLRSRLSKVIHFNLVIFGYFRSLSIWKSACIIFFASVQRISCLDSQSSGRCRVTLGSSKETCSQGRRLHTKLYHLAEHFDEYLNFGTTHTT